ncbi:hypothetical protein SH528x_002171 [Novipirellula sp. SH528]|uniref:hypothetical protein n=1 Tax=Novipirellula sp. SH528 TaxID=3454466 RepID=UPI003FA02E47
MDRVHAPENLDVDSIEHAAIAIGIPDLERPHQLHAGVVFRKSSDSIKLLHLRFHQDLAEEEVANSYFIIECDFIEERLQAVSALCRRIARRYLGGGISYGFTPPNDVFDGITGELLLDPTDTGLTCATFVLAVFQAARLPLVDLETWPPADELDRRWQRWVVEMLRRHTDDDAHANAVMSDVGAGRIRPEHVAAAAIQGTYPVSRLAIDDDADQIAYQLFDRHRNDLLDQHDDLVTATIRNLVESMYRHHRLAPFFVRLTPEQETCVRYHHPFRNKDYLTCYLDGDDWGSWLLAKLPSSRLLLEFMTLATIERNGADPNLTESRRRLRQVTADFLQE